ncbi:MAG: hypothetical protein KJN97_08380 [Deltaproteobacteria bacterium]|nr:hypothetical protein [Deltaproteobacteria bacterium]
MVRLSAAVGFDWASGAVRIYGDGNQNVAFISAKDVAKMFEAAGKPLKVEHAPESALQEQLAGADNDVMKSFLGLMITISRGDGVDTAAARAAYPNVQLTKVSDFVEQITS